MLRAFYIRIVYILRNRVDLSCVLLIFSLLHTLFCSNRISKAATGAQKSFEKQSPNLALFSSISIPQLIYLHELNLFNAVSQRYSTKESHPHISSIIRTSIFLSLRRHRQYRRSKSLNIYSAHKLQVKHVINNSTRIRSALFP